MRKGNMKKKIITYILIAIAVGLVPFYQFGKSIWYPVVLKVNGKQTVSEVIAKYKESTQANLAPIFEKSGIQYPPNKLALVAFKDEKMLHLLAANSDNHYKPIISYPIQAASGKLGPKLREGDHQVPEGIYKIIGFNPNSSFHLSMKINYPNEFDLMHAKAEGRDQPGTNIFIHGKAVSIGCLAMGDPVIEKLFTLVHEVGQANTLVLISPTDPTKSKLTAPTGSPPWTNDLYRNIEKQYAQISKEITDEIQN